MTSNKKARKVRAEPSDGFESDDIYFESRKKSQDRKTDQLCAQVRQTLSFLLETECTDENLQGFFVETVTPHPNAACLLVVLRQSNRDRAYEYGEILSCLGELKGYWRTQIGGAINRKKTPELTFQLLLDGGGS